MKSSPKVRLHDLILSHACRLMLLIKSGISSSKLGKVCMFHYYIQIQTAAFDVVGHKNRYLALPLPLLGSFLGSQDLEGCHADGDQSRQIDRTRSSRSRLAGPIGKLDLNLQVCTILNIVSSKFDPSASRSICMYSCVAAICNVDTCEGGRGRFTRGLIADGR